jgi:NAD(P)-dependent dehydrogenase (short-subunit alcohol dehydrogenase family)
VESSFDLTGARALVSGASRGIGRAIALELAAAGCDVVGAARSTDALASLAGEVESHGRSLLPLEVDLADVDALPAAVARAWDWQGGLDILVNAAGVIVRTGPLEVTPAQWDAVFAVNVRGTFFLTQEVGRRMLAASGGSIVTVTSLAGEIPTRAAVAYQASKAALIQLTRALAAQWAPTVRVNAVAPGYVRTDLNREWFADEANAAYVLSNTPLRRVAEPVDVVGAVRFLVSSAASYVTGQNVRVDGGWSVHLAFRRPIAPAPAARGPRARAGAA